MLEKYHCPICHKELEQETNVCPFCHKTFSNNVLSKEKQECLIYLINHEYDKVISFFTNLSKKEFIYQYYAKFKKDNDIEIMNSFFNNLTQDISQEDKNEIMWHMIEHKDELYSDISFNFLKQITNNEEYISFYANNNLSEKDQENELYNILLDEISIPNEKETIKKSSNGLIETFYSILMGLLLFLLVRFSLPSYILYESIILILIIPCIFLSISLSMVILKRKNIIFIIILFIISFYFITYFCTFSFHERSGLIDLWDHFLSICTSPYDLLKHILERAEI